MPNLLELERFIRRLELDCQRSDSIEYVEGLREALSMAKTTLDDANDMLEYMIDHDD